jgi:methylenetetrahydrofolate reductase (NADPH)
MKSLREALESGEFIVTAEIAPPKGTDTSRLAEIAKKLGRRVHAINVTDNQRAITRMSSICASVVLVQNGAEPICQITCRDRNRIGLQSDLLGAWALGIKNILALTGDAVQIGDNREAKPVFDFDSVKLLKLIDRLNQGINVDGKPLSGKPDLCAGGAVNPNLPMGDPFKRRFEAKLKAGARFFQSQPIFETGKLKELWAFAHPLGAKVLAGIMLLKSIKQATFLNEKVPGVKVSDQAMKRLEKASDQLQAGIELAAEQIRQFRGQCDGIHIMTVGAEDKIPEILERAGV